MIDYIIENWLGLLCIVTCLCTMVALACISVCGRDHTYIEIDFEQYKGGDQMGKNKGVEYFIQADVRKPDLFEFENESEHFCFPCCCCAHKYRSYDDCNKCTHYAD